MPLAVELGRGDCNLARRLRAHGCGAGQEQQDYNLSFHLVLRFFRVTGLIAPAQYSSCSLSAYHSSSNRFLSLGVNKALTLASSRRSEGVVFMLDKRAAERTTNALRQ